MYDYSYMGRVFDPAELSRIVTRCARKLKGIEFDSLVLRGTSGLVVGVPLSVKVKKPFGVVFKEGGHTRKGFKGPIEPGKFIIVDDFIETGNTIDTILQDPYLTKRKASCVGILLYVREYEDEDGAPEYNGIPVISL
jgi:adenine/guanine phosphoribosyltransferase-like PRPP-binding protein